MVDDDVDVEVDDEDDESVLEDPSSVVVVVVDDDVVGVVGVVPSGDVLDGLFQSP